MLENDSRYWLPRHVYAAVTPDGAIFLDLRHDKYFGLGIAQALAIQQVVGNWPAPSPGPPDVFPSEIDAYTCAKELAQRGLLSVQQPTREKRQREIDQRGVMSALCEDHNWQPKIDARQIANFVIACTTTAVVLRCRSLETIVEDVVARRSKAAASAGSSGWDRERATPLVNAFRSLRPYAFSAKEHCLYHALALINFLARYDLFPTWVIGVQTSPWAAHSWVQEGNQILDGTPEKTFRYVPILAV